jgi:penicillin G amidase
MLSRLRIVLGAVAAVACFADLASAQQGSRTPLAGLRAPAEITRDTNGIAHIRANQDHDLYFLQGWVHAQDRLFQMDRSRRLASGTFAELVGEAALETDVQLRTLGLRRAAERSLAVLLPQTVRALEAYAEGVNAFVASHPLPLEYGLLELSRFEPWTALDSVAVGKLVAFGLAFDLADIDRTIALVSYQLGAPPGIDGTKLFSEDLFRSAPFDPTATIPDATGPAPLAAATARAHAATATRPAAVAPAVAELGKRYLAAVKDLPVFRDILGRQGRGSNEWAVSGAHTQSGLPLLANDPHLELDTPSTFYPIHLTTGRTDVIGNGFAGVPFVVLGHSDRLAWGAARNPLDGTDVYSETIVPDAASPSGLSTVHLGQLEPIIPIPEIFRINGVGNGILDDLTETSGFTLIVPRRNHGPIVELDLAQGTGLSVQYVGFSATRELDTFRLWNEAQNLQGFQRALDFFDHGSLVISYADVRGNIAMFMGGEVPLREDLQQGTVSGLPPYFIRDGGGGNEWILALTPRKDQALAFEILPAAEMPQLVNPPAGFFVNANNDVLGLTLDNDPVNQLRPGGGILYLNAGYSGFRAGRITQLLRAKLAGGGKLSAADMGAIQADTGLIDAEVFVPYILTAFARAETSLNPALGALALAPGVSEAVGRLRGWDFTTPTGIQLGYDASDVAGVRSPPSAAEEAASVAATIYAIWRSRFVANVIDAVLGPLPRPDGERTLSALRHLLDNFESTGGVGASGIPFFGVGPSPADNRDIAILGSLAEALSALAGPAFATAFGSADQRDYRWGRIHRLLMRHPLGGDLSVPPAGGLFPHPLGAALPGIPVDGGYMSVDVASHDVRAAGENEFLFPEGPIARFVAEFGRDGIRAVSSLPGGVSGVLGPSSLNLLPGYLTNEAFPLWFRAGEIAANAASVTRFSPAH